MFTFDISASGTRLFGSRAVIVAALALVKMPNRDGFVNLFPNKY